MGIRETLNKNKALGPSIAIAFIVVAAILVYYETKAPGAANLEVAWYSNDDGQTWFKDSIYHIAPFDHNGKQAVIANVYSYDNGSKKFVPYMARYTDDGKKELEAAIADAQSKGQPPSSAAPLQDPFWGPAHMLIKRPGDKDWVPMNSKDANRVTDLKTPDGSAGDLYAAGAP